MFFRPLVRSSSALKRVVAPAKRTMAHAPVPTEGFEGKVRKMFPKDYQVMLQEIIHIIPFFFLILNQNLICSKKFLQIVMVVCGIYTSAYLLYKIYSKLKPKKEAPKVEDEPFDLSEFGDLSEFFKEAK